MPPLSYIERAVISQIIGACFDTIRPKPNWYLGVEKNLDLQMQTKFLGSNLFDNKVFACFCGVDIIIFK